jgi:hypothetical protein
MDVLEWLINVEADIPRSLSQYKDNSFCTFRLEILPIFVSLRNSRNSFSSQIGLRRQKRSHGVNEFIKCRTFLLFAQHHHTKWLLYHGNLHFLTWWLSWAAPPLLQAWLSFGSGLLTPAHAHRIRVSGQCLLAVGTGRNSLRYSQWLSVLQRFDSDLAHYWYDSLMQSPLISGVSRPLVRVRRKVSSRRPNTTIRRYNRTGQRLEYGGIVCCESRTLLRF